MANNPQKKDMEIRQLKHMGQDFYPLTNVKSVFDDNGNTIDIILNNIDIMLLEGYVYYGQAKPDTIPNKLIPNTKVYYISVTKGIYNNFKNYDTPIEITEEGTWAIKNDANKWFIEKLSLSTTTNNMYDETTKTYLEDLLITSQIESYITI